MSRVGPQPLFKKLSLAKTVSSVLTESRALYVADLCSGAGVTLEGCYLWDNVVIGDNCHLHKAILSKGVELKDNVTIEAGCLLSADVSPPLDHNSSDITTPFR